MDPFEITFEEKNSIVHIFVSGYFNAETGTILNQKGQELLEGGKNRFLLDFSKCTTVNSPGMSSLLDFSVIVNDDYLGKVVFWGLDESKKYFFKIVGILNVATVTDSPENALAELNKK